MFEMEHMTNKPRIGRLKRTAQVPREVRALAEKLSKADLLEAAFSLACLSTGEVDDAWTDGRGLQALIDEIQALRANAGRKPLSLPKGSS